MKREPLPKLARHGQTMLERKLISYFEWRKSLRYEWRMPDGTNLDPAVMPPLLGNFEFVSLFEIGVRVFLFQYKVDRATAVKFYYNYKPQEVKRAARKAKRSRRQRSRK